MKASPPRTVSRSPAWGKPSKPNFTEKTAELGRTMQEPRGGWRPAGNAVLGDSGPAWGSWAPPWGQKPLAHSLSLPTLRSGPSDKAKRKTVIVKTRELDAKAKKSLDASKELGFVVREMNLPCRKPEPTMSLEEAMEARKNFGWKDTKPVLPKAIAALIGYGDVLFEQPTDDDRSTMASTHGMSWQDSRFSLGDDSRSAMRDDSISLNYDSTSLKQESTDFLLPKAKNVNSTSQVLDTVAAPKNETRIAALRRENRELVQASWRLQHKLSPVKVSIEHMLC